MPAPVRGQAKREGRALGTGLASRLLLSWAKQLSMQNAGKKSREPHKVKFAACLGCNPWEALTKKIPAINASDKAKEKAEPRTRNASRLPLSRAKQLPRKNAGRKNRDHHKSDDRDLGAAASRCVFFPKMMRPAKREARNPGFLRVFRNFNF